MLLEKFVGKIEKLESFELKSLKLETTGGSWRVTVKFKNQKSISIQLSNYNQLF